MCIHKTLGVLFLVMLMTHVSVAQGTADIKNYFNETAVSVKATNDVVRKRELMDQSLRRMSRAISTMERVGSVSDGDRPGLSGLKTTLQDRLDELEGRNGFDRVADSQLDGFATYVVQDMQQAAQTVTISTITLLLLIILVILIA